MLASKQLVVNIFGLETHRKMRTSIVVKNMKVVLHVKPVLLEEKVSNCTQHHETLTS